MANLQHIKKRIQAVRNTEQITKAMKMVAAAKFRKAQEAVLRARPFAREMHNTLGRLARQHEEVTAHPLMVVREPAVSEELFILTSDRGLCGSFNSNVQRRVEHYLLDNDERRDSIYLSTIGLKGHRYFSRQKMPIQRNVENLLNHPNYRRAAELGEELAERYVSGKIDQILLVFNKFQSAVQQEVVFRRLLPIETPQVSESGGEQRDFVDYLYEPSKEKLLDRIIRRYLANQIFMFILESVASEHGARMTAMENATENAGEMIQQLTMVYNKARQASITKELMEIVSGAEALKG
jgi:F-type H+-transporting ATPase subunit gamma